MLAALRARLAALARLRARRSGRPAGEGSPASLATPNLATLSLADEAMLLRLAAEPDCGPPTPVSDEELIRLTG